MQAGTFPTQPNVPMRPLVPGPSLPIGVGGAGLVAVVVFLLLLFVLIGLYRALVDDATSVTADLFTHRWLGAFAHLVALAVVAAVVFAVTGLLNIVLIVGTIVWLVLVVFLVVAFYFAPIRIVAEDEGVVTALRESWSLTRGNRLRLFALGLIYAVAAAVVGGIVSAILGFVPFVGFLGNALVSAYFFVLNACVAVAAYDQLLDERASAGQVAGGDDGGDDEDESRTPQPTAAGG